MSVEQVEKMSKWANTNQAEGKPIIILPGNGITYTEAAERLFKLIGPTKTMFTRDGVPVVLKTRDDGLLTLKILQPAAARSQFEKYAQLMAWRKGQRGDLVLKPITCNEDTATVLLQSEVAAALLPPVRGLINCPVLREVNGKLAVAQKGYDEATHLLVTAGAAPSSVPLPKAIEDILALLEDFDFQSDGDKARAVASLITPALKVGGFIKERVPADVAEADQSQAGKTYRQRIIAAVYNERASLVTGREGGVGSVDESLNQQLIAGRPFIQFDNFRGRFDSRHLEAFLTADRSFPCRVPHRGEVTISPENTFIFLTSNGVDTTRDFANRSNIIRIRKRPAGHVFRSFPEGDVLNMVRQRQAHYLGSIHAVIREWHAQGKKRTGETRHDFREWAQVVDWIIQHVFRLCPVMEGHKEAQERVSSPNLVWLRHLTLAVDQAGELSRPLSAAEIHSLCESAGISIPGLNSRTDANNGARVIGTVMARIFKTTQDHEVGDYKVLRDEVFVRRNKPSAGGSSKSFTYTVTKSGLSATERSNAAAAATR